MITTPESIRDCVAPKRAFTLVELLVVIAIIGILIALVLSAVQHARESARLLQCRNNMKQLGLAMTAHGDSLRHLPTGGWGYRWVADPRRGSGRSQPGGWIFCILPYMEQGSVHDMAAGASNDSERCAMLAEMIQTPLGTFHCPSRRAVEAYPTQWQAYNTDPADAVAKTDYAANGGDLFVDAGSGPITLQQGDSKTYSWPDYKGTGICYLRSEVRLADIRDGTSNTYMIGEKNLPRAYYRTGNHRGDDQSMYSGDDFDTIRWTSPTWTPLNDCPGDMAEGRFGAAHSSGCNFAFCDGSVRTVSYMIEDAVHRNLGNRSDGQVVAADAF